MAPQRHHIEEDVGYNSLHLGGMTLVATHGDVTIYDTGGSPLTRLQRADLTDIIQFLIRSQRGV